MGLAALVAAAAVAASPVSYLQSHQQSNGGFAEPNGIESSELTAWAVVGLKATGGGSGNAAAYLAQHERELTSPTSIALVALAESVAGRDPDALLARLASKPRAVNEAIWHVLARRQAGRAVPKTVVNYLLASQTRSGGFGWALGVSPDSNDTAFALQALVAAGVRGRPIVRALTFMRRFQRQDGGFELARGRGSDAQSTAVAIQGFIAAGVKAPSAAFRYLARLRRTDGSYRYSVRYAATPVWVTSQVLSAVARKPLPLR